MNDMFGTLTQTFIINTTKSKNYCVFALDMFYETRHINAKKDFRVLSCFIYTTIENYVYIDYLDCQ